VSAYSKSGVNQAVGQSSEEAAAKRGFSLDEDF
jgi:ribonucleoside-diphosphate reductase subunit M2